MSTFVRVVRFMGRYGERAVDWCWQNRTRILRWVASGIPFPGIIANIMGILGR